MTSFLALYRGRTINDARLIGVATDPALVAEVASRMLTDALDDRSTGDPAVDAVDRGRRRALSLIAEDTHHE